MTGADWLLVAAIVVLFLASIWLAAGRDRVRAHEPGAGARARGGGAQAAPARLARMLEHPERTLNVVLLLALFPSSRARPSLGALLSDLGRCWGFVARPRVAVRAVLRDRRGRSQDVRASSTPTGPRCAIAGLARRSSPTSRRCGTLSRALIGLANLLLPGRGLKEGPFVTEEEIRHDGRRRRRRGGDRARGAPAHPLDLRVRRHGRARGR